MALFQLFERRALKPYQPVVTELGRRSGDGVGERIVEDLGCTARGDRKHRLRCRRFQALRVLDKGQRPSLCGSVDERPRHCLAFNIRLAVRFPYRLGILLSATCVASPVLAGCGGSSSTPWWVVRSRTVSGLGQVLVNGHDDTLYVYLPDHAGPSTCYSVCARAWPPLVLPKGVTTPAAGPGVRHSLMGTRHRRDGASQVTYNGWPLYTYIDDASGEISGQGEGMGAWYTISVNGTVDRQLPAS